MDDTEGYKFLVDTVYEHHSHRRPIKSSLIPILQDIQSELGYIPEPALERVSQLLGVSTSHIYGVTTFYHQFRLKPKGKHLISVCRGTACHVKGSLKINDFLVKELKITDQVDTSEDGVFTLQRVRCVGACSLAPVLKIDDDFFGNVDTAKVRQILSQYRRGTKT